MDATLVVPFLTRLPETTGTLTLRNGSSSVGATTAALTPGTLYRIGIHQKRGTGSNGTLEGFVATGDANFGTAFASSGTQTSPPKRTRCRLELRLGQPAALLWMITGFYGLTQKRLLGPTPYFLGARLWTGSHRIYRSRCEFSMRTPYAKNIDGLTIATTAAARIDARSIAGRYDAFAFTFTA